MTSEHATTSGGAANDGNLVAVVVPTYNEAGNIHELTDRLFALDIPNLLLIVVDDGSPDGTAELARQIGNEPDRRIHVIERARKMGLGPAYVAGFTQALEYGADYVVQMDADLSHPPEVVPLLVNGLVDSDVVIASRYVTGGGVDESWGVGRRLISSAGNWGIRLVTGVQVKDATGGFKAFRRDVVDALDFGAFRCAGYGFQTEVTHAAQRQKFIIAEQPYVFVDRTEGKSKMSLGIMLEAIWKLLPLRWSS